MVMRMVKRSYRTSRLTNLSTCVIIVLMLYMAMSPIYVYGDLTVTVSGRVVDEYGQGMENVEIKVYAFDETYKVEVYINSGSTLSDGSFAIGLTVGKDYTLHFSKEGYTKVTKSVSIKMYGTGAVLLGDVVLVKALRLSSSVSSRVASPGDKLTLSFTANNVGEKPEMVEFFVTKPEGWSTRILDQMGEVTKVYLLSGASISLQLEVTIPLPSAGKNSLSLTAVGKTNSTLDFMIEIQPLSKSVIFCQFPGKSAAPGDAVRFQIRLKNPLGSETSFKISLDSIPPNWTTAVKSATGEYVTRATLGSNEFVDLVVEVESPGTARIGEEYELLVKVESYDGNIVGSLPLSISLNKVEEETKIIVNVKFPDVTVGAGKIVQYPITIVNSGDANRSLLLSVEPPVDWKVVFKSGVLEVSSLFLEAGRSENLVIEVTPPSTVNQGNYTIPVQVKSETGAIYAETSLKARIVGSYALRLEPSTLLTSVTTGSSVTFTAKITNTGYTSVTSVSLGINVPSGWDSSITPIRVESLKPQESYTFSAIVNTPGDTVAGDYLITLTGLSDQIKSDSVQVRVTATTSTSWGLIGVGVAAVMVIALLFVFMKFRRR